MRIDKFLKNARIIKRRQIAKEACEQGRVTINGKLAKPGSEVVPNDEVSIAFSQGIFRLEVRKVPEHVRKEEATDLYRQLEVHDETISFDSSRDETRDYN